MFLKSTSIWRNSNVFIQYFYENIFTLQIGFFQVSDSFASEKLTLEKKQSHHGFAIKEKAKLFPSKDE